MKGVESYNQDIEDDVAKEPGKRSKEQIERYQAEGQRMIDSYRRMFDTFAQDMSLRFKLSNAFFIDYGRGEINLDTAWFADHNCSPSQIIWANLHELSHFCDLTEDPEEMLNNFKYIRERAKDTAKLIVDKYKKVGVEVDPIKAENSTYKMHHIFYNIVDDVYVNNFVARKAPKYEEEEIGGQEVIRLYQEKLFKETDYTRLPRHLQFVYKLMREEMVKNESVVVSEELEEIFKRELEYRGKKYTVKELIDSFIKPKRGRNTKAGTRYKIIQQTLEPIFEDLLKKDIEDWKPEKDQREEKNKGEGEGDSSEAEADSNPGSESKTKQDPETNPFKEEYDKYDKNNPDQFKEEEMKKWVEKNESDKKLKAEAEEKRVKAEAKAKAEKEKAEKKSAAEKAREAQEVLDKDWARQNNVDLKTLNIFKYIEAEIAPYLDELAALWRQIASGSSRGVESQKAGYFKTGDLNVAEAIEQWPEIDNGQLEDVRVMEQMVNKEVNVKTPEEIRFRIVGDLSGSMVKDNPERKELLKRLMVLILSSVSEFNTYLNYNRKETRTKLVAESEAWVFGSKALRIKDFRLSTDQDDRAKIMKTLKYLDTNMGSTADNIALEEISHSISVSDQERIAKGKLMEIVFEITDGVPNDVEATKKAITDLEGKGTVLRAYQIGDVSYQEKQIFNLIWNDGREEKLGELVGKDIDNLLPAVVRSLKDFLKNVRI